MKFYGVATAAGHLIPASIADQQAFQKLKPGVVYKVEATTERNILFHRKLFAMLNLAFEHWEPPPVDPKYEKFGTPKKCPDRFREEILIAAGWCELVYSMKYGEVRYVAKSISFSKLDDDLVFEGVYNRCLDAVLNMVLKNYKRDDLEQVIEQLLSFG